MGISYTRNFQFTKGRPSVPRISDANLDKLDEELANAMVFPYVPGQPRVPERDGNGGVCPEQTSFNVGIKSLEVGPGLVLRDQGDGAFIIELATEQLVQLDDANLRDDVGANLIASVNVNVSKELFEDAQAKWRNANRT